MVSNVKSCGVFSKKVYICPGDNEENYFNDLRNDCLPDVVGGRFCLLCASCFRRRHFCNSSDYMKRAIIIGLNYAGTENELPDCEIDAENMNTILKATGAECDVVKRETTPEALMSYIVHTAMTQHKKKDTLYIYFSGHGTQIPNREEVDRYDEAICLYNDRKGILLLKDHDLRAALDQVPGTKIVILDCCFAGGMEREAIHPDRKRKFIPFDERMVVYNLPDALKRQKAVSAGKTYFVFACSENEVSYSTGHGGLFTNALKRGWANELRTISKLLSFARIFCGVSQTPTAKIVGGNGSKRIL